MPLALERCFVATGQPRWQAVACPAGMGFTMSQEGKPLHEKTLRLEVVDWPMNSEYYIGSRINIIPGHLTNLGID